MVEEVDVRGLSCPEPVMRIHKKLIELGEGRVNVRADSATSRDNIIRMASQIGWSTEVT